MVCQLNLHESHLEIRSRLSLVSFLTRWNWSRTKACRVSIPFRQEDAARLLLSNLYFYFPS